MDERRLETDGFIGRGSFGEVWKVKFSGERPTFVKKIVRNIYECETVVAEVKVLSLGDCQFIPKLVYSGYTSLCEWCLILEHIDAGDLWKHIHNGSIILQKNKITIAYQLAIALDYLHSNFLSHG